MWLLACAHRSVKLITPVPRSEGEAGYVYQFVCRVTKTLWRALHEICATGGAWPHLKKKEMINQ